MNNEVNFQFNYAQLWSNNKILSILLRRRYQIFFRPVISAVPPQKLKAFLVVYFKTCFLAQTLTAVEATFAILGENGRIQTKLLAERKS
jgi:hypothetical protein